MLFLPDVESLRRCVVRERFDELDDEQVRMLTGGL